MNTITHEIAEDEITGKPALIVTWKGAWKKRKKAPLGMLLGGFPMIKITQTKIGKQCFQLWYYLEPVKGYQSIVPVYPSPNWLERVIARVRQFFIKRRKHENLRSDVLSS